MAAVGTTAAISLLRPLSPKLNFFDIPNQRKQHKGPRGVALIGGIRVFSGVLLNASLSLLQDSMLFTVLFCGSAIVVLGAVYDAKDIYRCLRLRVQSLLVILLCKPTGCCYIIWVIIEVFSRMMRN